MDRGVSIGYRVLEDLVGGFLIRSEQLTVKIHSIMRVMFVLAPMNILEMIVEIKFSENSIGDDGFE